MATIKTTREIAQELVNVMPLAKELAQSEITARLLQGENIWAINGAITVLEKAVELLGRGGELDFKILEKTLCDASIYPTLYAAAGISSERVFLDILQAHAAGTDDVVLRTGR